jgi:serine/threonine protein kinase
VAVTAVMVKSPLGPGGQAEQGAPGLALAQVQAAQADLRRTDFVGQVLDGRYRIEELIGEGGMGRVYLAEHVEIGRRVAIKILHPVYGRMPDLVERFRREARAASRIGHPHIVDVTDSGTTDDGSVYFVMEYLEGIELATVIDREGALDVARALRVATQICRALSAAHAVGIIHRDLKPENIFLTVREGAADFVKVLDFGIAKSSEAEEARGKRLTHPGMAMGTPEYMSPEQAAGRPADERCDVYAVGAILYEMITGTPPYEGDNFMEILTKKATLDPTPPGAIRNDLPPVVEALVQSAMARDPGLRPPSMEAFEYELTKCLAGRGVAVAKILGIPSESPLLGGLGPAYLPRDEVTPVSSPGAVASWRARMVGEVSGAGPGHASGSIASLTPPPAAQVGGVAVSPADGIAVSQSAPSPAGATPMAAAAPPMSEDTDLVNARVPDLRGQGLRLFGWAVLIMLLATGGGAVLLAIDSERGGDAGREKEATRPAVTAAPAAEQGAPAVRGPGSRDGVPGRGRDRGERGERGERDRKDARDPDRRDRDKDARGERASDGDGSGAPGSAQEARALLQDAEKRVSRLDWDGAKHKYERVASGKFQRQKAYLGLAQVAFETKRADDAISYARRAGDSPQARVLLGHAYYQKREYSRALHYYKLVLSEKPDHTEAQNGAKAARDKLGGGEAGSGAAP